MNDALIGHSGYVGTTLQRQRAFASRYRSTDIDQIRGKRFDLLICAGAPAQKWLANKEPERDCASLESLMAQLGTVQAETFVLISTVDVFKQPIGVDETSEIDEAGLHAYGRHRLLLERFVADRFRRSLIVRLPGLVGPGLRKNIIYDLHHDNNVDQIDSKAAFQFYPMVNLWFDIQVALQADLRVLHLTAEPVGVEEIARACFGMDLDQPRSATPARYDMRTIHAKLFGGHGAYQYSRRDTLLATRAYHQSEPHRNGEGAAR